MIRADKSKTFDALFDLYNRRLLRSHFASLRVAGTEHVQSLNRSLPMICFGNHSCWWDGLVVYHLSRHLLHADVFLMMEERQLARYRFFRKLGAFSVVRENAVAAAMSLRYAARLFDRPNRLLWIYPQGVMQPNDKRPLQFFPGAATIARLTGKMVQLIPFVHRYEFLEEQRPDAFVRFGKPVVAAPPIAVEETTHSMEQKVTELLDSVRSDVRDGKLEPYTTILKGRRSVNKQYDTLRGHI